MPRRSGGRRSGGRRSGGRRSGGRRFGGRIGGRRYGRNRFGGSRFGGRRHHYGGGVRTSRPSLIRHPFDANNQYFYLDGQCCSHKFITNTF